MDGPRVTWTRRRVGVPELGLQHHLSAIEGVHWWCSSTELEPLKTGGDIPVEADRRVH